MTMPWLKITLFTECYFRHNILISLCYCMLFVYVNFKYSSIISLGLLCIPFNYFVLFLLDICALNDSCLLIYLLTYLYSNIFSFTSRDVFPNCSQQNCIHCNFLTSEPTHSVGNSRFSIGGKTCCRQSQ